MGKTILTARQSHFLELAAKQEELINWYYFTGGTALAEFYLQHRYSEDLDFFTTSDVNDRKIDKIIKMSLKALGAKGFTKRNISGLFIYQLQFDDGALKIDFNNYPFELIEKGPYFGELQIDSFYDIGINKLYTILGRLQIRDFVDLYFILKQGDFSLEQLIARTNDKFHTDAKKMVQYFLTQAKILGKKAIQ